MRQFEILGIIIKKLTLCNKDNEESKERDDKNNMSGGF